MHLASLSNSRHFYHPKKKPYPLVIILHSTLSLPLPNTSVLSVSMDLPNTDILHKWKHTLSGLYIWPSLLRMFLRFIHVVAFIGIYYY